MTALPAKSTFDGTATPTTSTFKTAMGNLRDYLAGLLGTDGTAATARAALSAAASGANADITSLTALTKTLASYLWDSWVPSAIPASSTNAPATGTINDTAQVTLTNSAGTVTCQFDLAGTYLVNINVNVNHGNTFTSTRLNASLGGTATRRMAPSTINNTYDGAGSQNNQLSAAFLVTATAGQTLTVLPSADLAGGTGSTSGHSFGAHMTVLSCGV